MERSLFVWVVKECYRKYNNSAMFRITYAKTGLQYKSKIRVERKFPSNWSKDVIECFIILTSAIFFSKKILRR